MKKIILLGASGSIGTQTIDIIKAHSKELELVGASVYNNVDYLRQLLDTFNLKYVWLKEMDDNLKIKYPNTKFFTGEKGLVDLVEVDDYDLLVNALVGNVGCLPTIAAIKNHKDIALANKETLVLAGDIINNLLEENHVNMYPIDSEHSAIFQVLHGNDKKDIKRLIVTASGGAFRELTKEALKDVSLKDALKHPTWSMGTKVTIDSATLMNKVNEVIEAHHLFKIPYDQIDVIIQKESIIHSMVEFNDGSVLAQLSVPDMRLPIQYALLYPKHDFMPNYQQLDFDKLLSLNFMKVDPKRFSLFTQAKLFGAKGGNAGAILNGANDTAVALFMQEKISFIQIEEAIIYALNRCPFIENPTLEELLESRELAAKTVYDFLIK